MGATTVMVSEQPADLYHQAHFLPIPHEHRNSLNTINYSWHKQSVTNLTIHSATFPTLRIAQSTISTPDSPRHRSQMSLLTALALWRACCGSSVSSGLGSRGRPSASRAPASKSLVILSL